MTNKNFGFLRIVSDKKQAQPPKDYPLKQGTHSFGCTSNADIRLLLKNFTESILCVLNVDEQGYATLVNQSFRVPILVNFKQVNHSQTLKHNDKIQIASKHFIYLNENVNEQDIKNIEKSAKLKKSRQSALPLSTSRIPVKTATKTPSSKALRAPNTTSKAIQPVSSNHSNAIKKRLSLGNDRVQKPISTRNVRLSTEDKQEWEQQVKTPPNNKSFTKDTNSARRASRASIRTPKPPLMPSISEATERKPTDTETVSNSGCSTAFIVEDLMVFSLKDAKNSNKTPNVGGIADESMINFYTPENNTSIVTLSSPLESGKVTRKSKTLNRTISSDISTPKSIMCKKRGRESSETVEKTAKKLKPSTSISFINRNLSFEEESFDGTIDVVHVTNIESPVICATSSQLKSNRCMTEPKPNKRTSLRRKSIAAIKCNLPTNDERAEMISDQNSDKNVTKRRRKSAYAVRAMETEFQWQTKRSRSLGARRNTEIASFDDVQLKHSSTQCSNIVNGRASSVKSNRCSVKSEICDSFECQSEDEVFKSVSVVNQPEMCSSNSESLRSELEGMQENGAVKHLSQSMIEMTTKNSRKTRSKSLGVVKLNSLDSLQSQSEEHVNISTKSRRRSSKSVSVIENNESFHSQLEEMKENNSRTTRNKSHAAVQLNTVVNVKRKPQKSPKNDLTQIRTLRGLFSPNIVVSPINDLTNVRNLRRLFSAQVLKSPLNDLTDVRGVRQLMSTPKPVKSPKNELNDFVGVRKLLRTPKPMKSPKNDLSDVKGLRKLLGTPKPKPKTSPKNDLTDVKGLKKLFLNVKSPKNDLTDVRGVKEMFKHIQSPVNSLLDVSGIQGLFVEKKNVQFDVNDSVLKSGEETDEKATKRRRTAKKKETEVEEKPQRNTRGRKKVEETKDDVVVVVAPKRTRRTKKNADDKEENLNVGGDVLVSPKRTRRGTKIDNESLNKIEQLVEPKRRGRGKKNANLVDDENKIQMVDEPKRSRRAKQTVDIEQLPEEIVEKPKRGRRVKQTENVAENVNEAKQMENRSTRKRKPDTEKKTVEETAVEPLRRSKRTCTKR